MGQQLLAKEHDDGQRAQQQRHTHNRQSAVRPDGDAVSESAPPSPLTLPRASESQLAILPALLRAQSNFRPIKRQHIGNAENGDHVEVYRYATLADHFEAVTKPLNEAGLLLTQDIISARGGYGGTIAREHRSANPSFENAAVIDRLICDGLLQPGSFFNTYVLTPKGRKATRGPRAVAHPETTS